MERITKQKHDHAPSPPSSSFNFAGSSSAGVKGTLWVVSNRLPVTLKKSEDGYTSEMSSGGLVTGLSGVKKTMKFTWIGWPGLNVSDEDKPTVIAKLREDDCYPVFVDDKLADRHYNGFSNSILWPLFHYHPQEMSFNKKDWEAYQDVNKLFAETISNLVQDKDFVFVQDYHLMLLPRMLREQLGEAKENVKIGFFLHTPFPTYEIFRILPVRNEILKGVLKSDLIGFHTNDYIKHFLSSCARILDLSETPNSIEYEGRRVRVKRYPIGIDPVKFTKEMQNPVVKDRIRELRAKFTGRRVIIGVDRLDYIKGITQKFSAFENFLSRYSNWKEKVILVQVAIPSREDVEEYRNLRSVVQQLSGRINGTYGTIDYTPIQYLHKSIKFDELVAYYALADVCLVSSTRDGMNLVSYEYTACQTERHGVLILSEFAGAAELLTGSIRINPWNTEEVADAINEALTMPAEQRKENQLINYKRVIENSALSWGTNFVNDLAG